jgi:hexosaminidase
MGNFAQNECYSLTIGTDRIVVRGIEAVGAARGLTTLVQYLATTPPGADGAVVLHAAHILDAPRFAWRSLHFDVVRTFFTVKEVKRVIDLLAVYKCNALSIHLTDDEAWRIEAGRPAGYKSDAPFYTKPSWANSSATPRTDSSRSFPWSTPPATPTRWCKCAPN